MKVFVPIKSGHTSTGYILVKTDFLVPINCPNCQSGLVLPKIHQTKAKEPFVDPKYTGVRTRTPCIFFTCFIFVKNDFPVPINCLNCQSELVMPKIYQTEAKKPLVYSNYTGVRACTPCTFAPKNGVRARTPIHFSFISNFSKLIFWV